VTVPLPAPVPMLRLVVQVVDQSRGKRQGNNVARGQSRGRVVSELVLSFDYRLRAEDRSRPAFPGCVTNASFAAAPATSESDPNCFRLSHQRWPTW